MHRSTFSSDRTVKSPDPSLFVATPVSILKNSLKRGILVLSEPLVHNTVKRTRLNTQYIVEFFLKPDPILAFTGIYHLL